MNPRQPSGHPYPQQTPMPGRWTPAPPPLGGGFTDRVMARVAQEPRPTPTRALVHSLRHLALRDALAALMTAWRIAFEPARPVPAGTRVRSAALLLGVVIVFGVGTPLVFSGALALLGRDGGTPAQLEMGASPSPAVLQPTLSPSPSPSPTPSLTLSPTPAPPAARTAVPRTEATTTRPRQTPDAEDERRSSDDRTKIRRETPEPKGRDDDERRDREDD